MFLSFSSGGGGMDAPPPQKLDVATPDPEELARQRAALNARRASRKSLRIDAQTSPPDETGLSIQ